TGANCSGRPATLAGQAARPRALRDLIADITCCRMTFPRQRRTRTPSGSLVLAYSTTYPYKTRTADLQPDYSWLHLVASREPSRVYLMLKYWLIRTYDLQRDLPGHGHGGELRYGAGEQQAEGRASVTGAISTDFGMADYGFMTGPDEGDRGVATAGPGEARLLRELCHDLIELVASIK